MKKILTLLFCFNFYICYSQITFVGLNKYDTWLNDSDTVILNSMKLNYTKPIGFREVNIVECFDGNTVLNEHLKCQNHQLLSKDTEMLLFIELNRIMDGRDSIDINKMFPGSITNLNFMHNGVLRSFARVFKNAEGKEDWKEYVSYRSDLSKRFGADTVITYATKLDSLNVFQGKYDYLLGIVLQKHNRGYVHISCFLTKKAYSRKEKYLKILSKMLVYK